MIGLRPTSFLVALLCAGPALAQQGQQFAGFGFACAESDLLWSTRGGVDYSQTPVEARETSCLCVEQLVDTFCTTNYDPVHEECMNWGVGALSTPVERLVEISQRPETVNTRSDADAQAGLLMIQQLPIGQCYPAQ